MTMENKRKKFDIKKVVILGAILTILFATYTYAEIAHVELGTEYSESYAIMNYENIGNLSISEYLSANIVNATSEVYVNNSPVSKWLYNQTASSKYYYNQTLAGNSMFLNLSGTNANQNLDITPYNLTADTGFFNKLKNIVTGWFTNIHVVFLNATTVNATTINSENITATGYFFGQPIEGYLGSGIIWAEEVNANGNLNVSHVSGLDVDYPGFVMRLVKTDNSVKYCNISGNTVTVPDDTHSVYYIDSDCNVQHTSIQNYIDTDLSPGGLADFFNVVSDSGTVGIIEGAGLMNKEDIKIRKNTFKLSSLNVISGLSLTQEGFPNISIEGGEYSYINEIFEASPQNTSNGDTIILLYRQGGSWTHESQTGLNLTWCDDGTI